MTFTDKQLARFWGKVDKDGPLPADRPELGKCWLWGGALDRKGYGRLWVYGTMNPRRWTGAHRFAYELERGDIGRFVLDHLCSTPRCVNPDHLEPVSQRENLLRSPRTGPGRAVRETHFKCGHPKDGDVYIDNGSRRCRPCRNEQQRARRLARLAKAGDNRTA